MDDDEFTPPIQSRSQAFGEGLGGGQQASPSPSLQALAQRYNARIPRAYRPSGSLNGMSLSQYKRTLGGQFGTGNGSSADTWETKKFFGGN